MTDAPKKNTPAKKATPRKRAPKKAGIKYGSGPAYFIYAGDARNYPTLGDLQVTNGSIVDFSTLGGTPPPDGRWTSNAGPANTTPSQPGFVWPGGSYPSFAPLYPAWTTNTSFAAGQTVISPADGMLTICQTSHVSGTYATDLAAGKWTETLTQAAGNAAYAPFQVLEQNGLHRRMAILDPTSLVADRATTPLTIPTYDSTGQSNHPDVFYAPDGWGSDSNGKAWHWYMAMTPLAGDNNALENPSIVVSDDGLTWVVPPGLTNPIAPNPGAGEYNSDPDLELGPDNKLYCFYRPVLTATEDVCYRSSPDGITWSSEQIAITSAGTSEELLSPTIVWDTSASLWRMWVVNAVGGTPFKVQMRTCATLTGTWSAPVNCTLAVPTSPKGAMDPWHIDVIRYGGQFAMCINSTGAGGAGQGGYNWLAISPDGVTWTVAPKPLTDRGSGGGFARWDNEPYRACFVPVDSGSGVTLRLYYSANGSLGWRIGVTTVRTDAPKVLRTSLWLPEDHGLIGWSCDPALAVGASNTLAGGQPTYVLLKPAVDGYCDRLIVVVSTAGTSLTSGQCFLALYDMTGAEVGVTADLSAALASTGTKLFSLTSTTRLLKAGEKLAATILVNGTGTMPKFQALANPPINVNLTATSNALPPAAPWRSGTLGSSLTAMPGSVTWSGAGQGGWVPFVGLVPSLSL